MRTLGWMLLLLCCMGAVQAGDLFRWTERKSAQTNGDRTPEHIDPQPRSETRDQATGAREPAVSLRFERRADAIEVWADNNLGGTIEVLLRPQHGTVASADPPLPARAVVPALQRTLIARLGPKTVADFWWDVTPGDPNARPKDVEYGYPLHTTQLQIEQSWGGVYSHSDAQNRHAVDFAADIGTPVIAARAGTVMEVESDFDRAGLNAEQYAGRANFVRIVHDDGTMALYAHLKPDGVLVRVGQRVRKAEVIGLSGNTGFTTGPHLHFVVQANRGMKLESIPFRMFGPQGILRFSEPNPDQQTPPQPL
ncbi:MAG: M23 family metallopeptidase [Lysobacteraceae bacterium]